METLPGIPVEGAPGTSQHSAEQLVPAQPHFAAMARP